MCFIGEIIKLFETGNVCVTGLRGTGKDLLMSNVIVRRKKPYVSNIDYTHDDNYQELDLKKLDINNDYKNFINNNLNYYEFPYIQGSDIYCSDVGVYFPSQYCGELNKDYKSFPLYMALSRQVSHNNFHINCQNLNRCYDKIREQSDIYIRCNKVIYLFGLVIQFVTIYDKYESCVNRVKPCRITVPLFANEQTKLAAQTYYDNFCNTHGSVVDKVLIYFNKSTYDTYYFEKMLLNGKKKGGENA